MNWGVVMEIGVKVQNERCIVEVSGPPLEMDYKATFKYSVLMYTCLP